MTEIKLCASVICVALISFGVMQMLLPEGSTQRVAQTVFGIASMVAIILPIAQGIKVVDWPSEGSRLESDSTLLPTISEQMRELTAPLIESAVAEALEPLGISRSQISLEMDISESGGISIKCVTIKDVSQDVGQQVRSVLLQNFGIEPEDVEVEDG